MCRLLGLVTPTPSTIADVLGPVQLGGFRDLSRLHCDGWGAAFRTGEEDGVRVHRSTGAALTDPDFDRLTASTVSDMAIAHLRWASRDMATQNANTHPFSADGFAFAHNGYVAPAAELDRLVPPSAATAVRGSTDSERYFAIVRGYLHAGHEPLQAVEHAVGELRALYPHASLNALMLGPDELIAVHASSHATPDIDAMLGAGFTSETLPAGHLREYYQMRIRRGADGSVAVASSGLATEGWQALPPESITRIHRTGATVTGRPELPDFIA